MFTHKIVIQNPKVTRDAHGGFKPVQANNADQSLWDTISTAYAKVRMIRGGNSFQAEQFNANLTHTFTIRYSPTVIQALKQKQTRISIADCGAGRTRYFSLEYWDIPRERKQTIELFVSEVL